MARSRAGGHFKSIEETWRRATVPVATLRYIAAADGFAGLGLSRRRYGIFATNRAWR
ncbi:hypothetical protein IVB21_06420 [Bradyrhizobium sp. 18]|nr:hypothetical protein [Bradyrhizobium sp. 18]